MTARFCPYCGQPVVAGGTFCPSCGAAVGGGSTPPGALPRFAPTVGAPPGYGAVVRPSAPSQTADLSALSSVTVAALIALAGVILGLAALASTNLSGVLTVGTARNSTSLSLEVSGLYLLAATSGAGLFLTMAEVAFYRRAFRTLTPHDPRFSTPATLCVLLLVGFVIVLAVGAAIFVVIYQAIICAGPGNPITSACVNTGTLLELIGLLGVAAIVVLIGYLGLLIGIWRLGTRYGEALFKVGAVLLLIPLANFVGVILILLAARASRAKLGAASSANPYG